MLFRSEAVPFEADAHWALGILDAEDAQAVLLDEVVECVAKITITRNGGVPSRRVARRARDSHTRPGGMIRGVVLVGIHATMPQLVCGELLHDARYSPQPLFATVCCDSVMRRSRATQSRCFLYE